MADEGQTFLGKLIGGCSTRGINDQIKPMAGEFHKFIFH